MKIKTIWIRADFTDSFDSEVNKLLQDGWALKKREVIPPYTADKATMLYAEFVKPGAADLIKDATSEDPDQITITLDPDIEYLLEATRGTSTLQDYLNTIIPLGVACAQRFKGKMEDAVYQILYGDFLNEKEEDDAEV